MAKKAVAITTCLTCGDTASGKDLKDPAMTLENNPYMRGTGCPIEEAIERRNDDRLWADRSLRRNTATGRVYSGIMDMRYGG